MARKKKVTLNEEILGEDPYKEDFDKDPYKEDDEDDSSQNKDNKHTINDVASIKSESDEEKRARLLKDRNNTIHRRFTKLEDTLNQFFKDDDIEVTSIYILNDSNYLMNITIDNCYYNTQFNLDIDIEDMNTAIATIIRSTRNFARKCRNLPPLNDIASLDIDNDTNEDENDINENEKEPTLDELV